MLVDTGSRLGLLLIVLLSICIVASAQESNPLAVLSRYPECAQQCILKEVTMGTCSPTDMNCICTSHDFQSSVTHCVTQDCTVIEALATKNSSMTMCGAPIRDHGTSYLVLSYVMIVLAGVFVIIRFAFKIIEDIDLGLDDWTVLATLCSGIALTPVCINAIKSGLGKDIWTLRPDQITRMLLYFDVVAVLYFTTLTLLKLSIIFFYIRIFSDPCAQRLLWGTAVFTLLWGVVYVIVVIFQCQPINYFWNRWDGLHEGRCLNIIAITASNAGISIALDFWSLGIPLWQLWGLKMHWKRKMGVALMFGVGTFVTVVSILRLQSLVLFAKSENVSWDFYPTSRWSTIECGVGTMCVCLPTIRLLFVKLFPVLDGSSNRNQKRYRKYGNDDGLKNLKIGRGLRTLTSGVPESSRGSKESTNLESDAAGPSAVGCHSYIDGDEISLVDKNVACSKTERVRKDDDRL